MLEIRMLDGSVFRMPSQLWEKAFDIKYGDRKVEAIEAFKRITAKHFEEKTVPTKFGFDEPWSAPDQYKTHAELGKDVMYVYIRTALLAVVLEEVSKRTGRPTPRVIGVDEDGTITEYTGHSRKKLTSLDQLLDEGECNETE